MTRVGEKKKKRVKSKHISIEVRDAFILMFPSLKVCWFPIANNRIYFLISLPTTVSLGLESWGGQRWVKVVEHSGHICSELHHWSVPSSPPYERITFPHPIDIQVIHVARSDYWNMCGLWLLRVERSLKSHRMGMALQFSSCQGNMGVYKIRVFVFCFFFSLDSRLYEENTAANIHRDVNEM